MHNAGASGAFFVLSIMSERSANYLSSHKASYGENRRIPTKLLQDNQVKL